MGSPVYNDKLKPSLQKGIELPQDFESECQLIAACLQNNRHWQVAKRQVGKMDFYHQVNRGVWWAMEELDSEGSPVEIVAVSKCLGDYLDHAGGLTHLSNLSEFPDVANVQYYIDRVKDYCGRRQVIAACETLTSLVAPSEQEEELTQEQVEQTLATLAQHLRKSSSAKKRKKTDGSRNLRNFSDFSNAQVYHGQEVDQLSIAPTLPEAATFPITPMHEAILAIQDRTQAPYELCAQSVLASVTLAAQHLADVEIPGIGGKGALRPISNFFVTVARSGERKSSADRITSEGIKIHQKSLESHYRDQNANYQSKLIQHENEAQQARRDGKYIGEPPTPPREPVVLVREPTADGMFSSLKRGQQSQGLFNDEGGAFLGGYGMSRDNRMRTAAIFNKLWDGAELDRPRNKEFEILRGVRLSAHLMIQPKASASLTNDPQMEDLGFLARCLIAEPASTIGERSFRQPSPESILHCEAFAHRLHEMLNTPGRKNETGELEPAPLCCNDAALGVWIDFYNEVEAYLSTIFSTIQGFAGKAPEHALRLAAVLTLFANPSATAIGGKAMETGVSLVRYYLSQHLRLQTGKPSEDEENAELLMEWLRDKWGSDVVSFADIYQRGPNRIRKRPVAESAVAVAIKAGHLLPLEGSHLVQGNGMKEAKNRRQCYEILPLEN